MEVSASPLKKSDFESQRYVQNYKSIYFEPIFNLIDFNFLVVQVFKISFIVEPTNYPFTLEFC